MKEKPCGYFYMASLCTTLALIFPTHVSQAIGFDVGDFIHWSFGFYIFIPRTHEYITTLFFDSSFYTVFLTGSAVVFTIMMLFEGIYLKRKNFYHSELVITATLVLLASVFIYSLISFIVIPISLFGYSISIILSIIGIYKERKRITKSR